MNWVGGVRSRLRKKNDKKIQQQFFEQKRQEKKYGIKRKFSPKKTEGFSIGQDMLSLQTVLKAHDSDLKKKGVYIEPKKPRHVDLNGSMHSQINHNKSILSTSPVEAESQIDFHRADENHTQAPFYSLIYEHSKPTDVRNPKRPGGYFVASSTQKATPCQNHRFQQRSLKNPITESIPEERSPSNNYFTKSCNSEISTDVLLKKKPSYFNLYNKPVEQTSSLFSKDIFQSKIDQLQEKSTSNYCIRNSLFRGEVPSPFLKKLETENKFSMTKNKDVSVSKLLTEDVEIFNPYSKPGPHSKSFKNTSSTSHAVDNQSENMVSPVTQDMSPAVCDMSPSICNVSATMHDDDSSRREIPSMASEMSPIARRKLNKLLDDESSHSGGSSVHSSSSSLNYSCSYLSVGASRNSESSESKEENQADPTEKKKKHANSEPDLMKQTNINKERSTNEDDNEDNHNAKQIENAKNGGNNIIRDQKEITEKACREQSIAETQCREQSMVETECREQDNAQTNHSSHTNSNQDVKNTPQKKIPTNSMPASPCADPAGNGNKTSGGDNNEYVLKENKNEVFNSVSSASLSNENHSLHQVSPNHVSTMGESVAITDPQVRSNDVLTPLTQEATTCFTLNNIKNVFSLENYINNQLRLLKEEHGLIEERHKVVLSYLLTSTGTAGDVGKTQE
ncbi:uncharacterized protein C12orf40-like [Hydractinia symbiolongicarpus]|uniref:uncharacterized protein C12orf40-like n=1 Tax=Hydractinia symbiolongicarpus TaxID=13093 RepID=UPI00254A54E9|nr:uncharacterized protein C12orf40-like [Hydractinia symbiolongicarpus]